MAAFSVSPVELLSSPSAGKRNLIEVINQTSYDLYCKKASLRRIQICV